MREIRVLTSKGPALQAKTAKARAPSLTVGSRPSNGVEDEVAAEEEAFSDILDVVYGCIGPKFSSVSVRGISALAEIEGMWEEERKHRERLRNKNNL